MIERRKNGIAIFVTVCIFGIIIYWNISPFRKWYYIFKVQIYGWGTRLKIYMIVVVDKIFRYLDI